MYLKLLSLSLSVFKKNKVISLFLLANLIIGLFVPVTLFSYKEGLSRLFLQGGKGIIGGDLSVSSRIKPRDTSLNKIDEFLQENVLDKAFVLSLYSMASSKDTFSMVQIRSIEGNFPFYGDIKTRLKTDIKNLKSHEVIVKNDLLLKFNINIGDSLKINNTDYKIVDVIDQDVNEGEALAALGPRLYMGMADLNNSGLVSFGSTIHYNYVYKLKEINDPVLFKNLKNKIQDSDIRIQVPSNANNMLQRTLQTILDFSQVIFLAGLLISLATFCYVFKYFIEVEKRNISSYLMIGLTLWDISLIYLLYFLMCFVVAISFIVTLVSLVFPLIFPLISNVVNMDLTGIGFNVPYFLILLFFVFIVFLIYPFILSAIKNSNSKSSYLSYFMVLVTLIFLVYYQTNSLLWAPLFVASIILFLVLFYYLLPFIFNLLSNTEHFILRFSFLSLARNKGIMLSKFTIIFLMVLILNIIPTVFNSLKKDIKFQEDKRPDYFAFDIQDEQKNDVEDFFHNHNIRFSPLSPMIRARLLSVDGKKMTIKDNDSASIEEDRQNRAQNRSVNISYQDALNNSEFIVKGIFFDGKKAEANQEIYEVSLEKKYADRIGADIGSRLDFEIFDVEFKTVVTSLRSVKWTSFLPNFFILFQDGVLNDAPKTYLSALSNIESYTVIKEFNNKFKTISLIDVKGLTSTLFKFLVIIENILDQMVYIFLFISLVSFLTLTFFSIKISRKENRLLNTLGLTFDEIKKVRIVEFISLSFFSIFLASIIAYFLSYFILVYYMGLSFSYSYISIASGLLIFISLIFYHKRGLGFGDNLRV